MKCRICGKEIDCLENLGGSEKDVNSVYRQPTATKSQAAVFGYCEVCKHGQLEYVFGEEHYSDYNLLNIEEDSLDTGGNAARRKEYYTGVLKELGSYVVDSQKILDIGCGHGTIMKYAGDVFECVKGVEPSRVEYKIALKNGCDVTNAYFDRSWQEEDFSAFVSTQVLEHLPSPREILLEAYRVLKVGGGGYIDVPNGYKIYLENQYYNVNLEHINYFSVNSLAKLLNESGFTIVKIGEVLGGAHIAAFVKKEHKCGTFMEQNEKDILALGRALKEYRKVALWGAGMKGRIYIKNLLQLREVRIRHIFDNNEALHGLYMGNCSIPVEKPSEKEICQTDLIIITAVEYKEEITKELREIYHYKGELLYIGQF